MPNSNAGEPDLWLKNTPSVHLPSGSRQDLSVVTAILRNSCSNEHAEGQFVVAFPEVAELTSLHDVNELHFNWCFSVGFIS